MTEEQQKKEQKAEYMREYMREYQRARRAGTLTYTRGNYTTKRDKLKNKKA